MFDTLITAVLRQRAFVIIAALTLLGYGLYLRESHCRRGVARPVGATQVAKGRRTVGAGFFTVGRGV